MTSALLPIFTHIWIFPVRFRLQMQFSRRFRKMFKSLLLGSKNAPKHDTSEQIWCRWRGSNPHELLAQRILSYSSHSEPNGLNRNKTVFSVTFQNIKNPKKPYKISIFDAKHQKYKQFVPSSIIGSQIPNLRRWRDVGGM